MEPGINEAQIQNKLLRFIALFLFASMLTACGGGDESPNPAPMPDPTPTPAPDPTPAPTPTPPPAPAIYSADLSWNIPDSRENGDILEVYEIGGYEIPYKLTTDANYTSIIVNDSSTSTHQITGLVASSYEFKMATFDIENIYSDFTSPQSSQIGS